MKTIARKIFIVTFLLFSAHVFAQTENPWEKQRRTPSHLNNVMLYGGFNYDLMSSIGNVKNFYLYGKARVFLMDFLLADISLYHNPGGYSRWQNIHPETYYYAHLAFGKTMGPSFGIEWGDRYFTAAKDSGSHVYYQFHNLNTGQKRGLSNFQINQQMRTYAFGFCMMGMRSTPSFWRDGKGHVLSAGDITMEILFAPKINYDTLLDVSPWGLSAPEVYSVENLRVKHWGFRIIAEIGGSANLSFHQEIGIRPGICPIEPGHKEALTSRIYIMMGATFFVSAGGKRYM